MTSPDLRDLLDRAEIGDLLNRYASAIDGRDWPSLRTVFADEIEADFTSLGNGDPFRGPAEEWVEWVRRTVEGFDATQHIITNAESRIDGDEATCRANLQAMHVLLTGLGDPHYLIGGYYHHDLVRTAEGWRSRRYRLTITWTRGNRYLFRQARQRMEDRMAERKV